MRPGLDEAHLYHKKCYSMQKVVDDVDETIGLRKQQHEKTTSKGTHAGHVLSTTIQ
jgi:hypothetical protein